MFRVVQVDTLGEVKGEDWDRLATSDPLAGYGWLRATERQENAAVRSCYLLASDTEGLAGAFACTVDDTFHGGTNLDQLLFGEARGIARAMGLSSRIGITVQKRVYRPGLTLDRQRQLVGTLLDELNHLASKNQATVCFRLVMRHEGVLDDLLRGAGYAASLDLPLARLAIRPDWSSFADYRRDLKKAHPSTEATIRQELNRARKHGLITDEVHDPGLFPPLHRLLSDHYQRLNGQTLPWHAGLLDRLKQHLGDRAMILRGSIGGEPVSVCLGVRAGAHVAFPSIGVDHARSRDSAAYFNTVYNYSIQRCLETKTSVVCFGTLVYDLKVRRGCALEPTRLFVRHPRSPAQMALRRLLRLRSARVIQKHDLGAMGSPAVCQSE